MRLSSQRFAFSLIEVTLSIGIVAFAFVGLFGLLPVGLQTFRSAIDTDVRAQIAQQLVTRAQQTEFASLPNMASASPGAPTYYYFDDQAVEMPQDKRNASMLTAAVTCDVSTALPSTSSSTKLATLHIDIFNNRGAFNGNAPAGPKPVRYSMHLADFGQRL